MLELTVVIKVKKQTELIKKRKNLKHKWKPSVSIDDFVGVLMTQIKG